MTKPNKHGCRVSGDVCIIHDQPLFCKHGCEDVIHHKCRELRLRLDDKYCDEKEKRKILIILGVIEE